MRSNDHRSSPPGWSRLPPRIALVLGVAVACSGEQAGETLGGDTLAAGTAAADRPPAVGTDDSLVYDALPVNRGARGMFTLARWVRSPDGDAILVVEDGVGIEAEPFPDGFLFASEALDRTVHGDSVWSVAPSPDWTRVAFGKAYRVSARERDSLSASQWEELARRAGMPVRDVRAGAFEASGMAVIKGFAQPGVIDVRSGARRVFPVAAGWRVGWSADGSRLAAGRKSEVRVQDDAPADRWVALDPSSGTPLGEIPPGATLAAVAWVEGPTIDISVRPDTGRHVGIPIDEGRVESQWNVIRRNGRVVGPGVALAATRTGRYIVALVPRLDATEYEAKEMLVVYAARR
ncbi:MAG: hypothetical protein M3373_05490 [Gemmatimonadota bacterium]|nr:hypothetical protein [Gemmatimonadota bacterium]